MRSTKILVLAAAACVGLLSASAARAGVGAVYTMSNGIAANEVWAFDRGADGSLEPAGSYSTGGQGTGMGLGNQGGVILTADERFLLVVNAGSSDVSVFKVTNGGLQLTDTESSGGVMPISVTAYKDLVYVLNAGSSDIAGFQLSNKGKLSLLPGSIQPVSAPGVAPAQIEFDPSGSVLVVTEKDTNKILTYKVGHDGVAWAPTVHDAAGVTPYGFAFGKRGQLVVSEAAGGAMGAATASSYELSKGGDLDTITPAASANGSAACWVVITGNGRFAYTSNTASNNLSIFEIGFDGELTLLGAQPTGPGPLDSAVTNNSRFLYVFNNGDGTLSGFRVESDGSLTPIPLDVNGLAGANGLAAR